MSTTSDTPGTQAPATEAPQPTKDTPTAPLPGGGTETSGAVAPGPAPTAGVGDSGNPISNAVPSSGTSTTSTSGTNNNSESSSVTLDDDGQEGEDLYEAVCKLAPFAEMKPTMMSNKDNIKIGCYFVHKMHINQKSTIYLKYGAEVQNIIIRSGMTEFGTSCILTVADVASSLTTLLEYQTNYYFVIAIMNVYDENSTENALVYQPYIFEIDKILPISADSNVKTYKITLSDILSATLKKVSYGNMLLQYPDMPNAVHYGELYNYFVEYAAKIINTVHNKKYKIPTKIFFKSLNSDSISVIIKAVIFKDLPIDTIAYNLLNKIFIVACRELTVSENFSKKAEVKGPVLTPLFLTDEWEDASGLYRSVYNVDTNEKVVKDITFSGEVPIKAKYFRRSYSMKHLQMPFQLAFSEDKPAVYETINPKYENGKLSKEDQFFVPMNGFSNSVIDNSVEVPFDGASAGFGWRNLALMADTPSGGSNALIYFNWIYEYYKNVYLNYEESKVRKELKKALIPVVDPNFHQVEIHGLMGGDADFFAKANSSVIRLRSEDPIKESLMHVGRAVKSFIFMNALTGFKINGNIIRHPGEIIKLNNAAGSIDDEVPQQSVGGVNSIKNGYGFFYITHVMHCFSGTNYNDVIYCTKLCNIFTDEEITEEEKNVKEAAEANAKAASTSTSSSDSSGSAPSNSTTTPTQTGTPGATDSSTSAPAPTTGSGLLPGTSGTTPAPAPTPTPTT
jgi:hypothetical protein